MHAPKALPKADPGRFSIAVANLGQDPDHGFEEQLINTLRTFEGDHTAQAVQILRFDREISSDGTEESERVGNRLAQKYLGRTGAQVLIWGTVLSNPRGSAYRLCWTTSENPSAWRNKELYRIENFTLPVIFWKDLVTVLHLVVAMQSGQFFDVQGSFIIDKLRPFVERVGKLFDGSQKQAGWDTAGRIDLGLILAAALQTLGEQSGLKADIERAIDVSKEVLEMTSRERRPLEWAAAQSDLAIALWLRGKHESKTNYLEQAVAANRSALQEYTREQAPLNWAMTQNNLGLTLTAVGEREVGTQLLAEGVAAYRSALMVFTRERAPVNWATTFNQAVLQEYRREQSPQNWAEAQVSRAMALTALGKREPGTKHLAEAEAVLRTTLKECSREQVPLLWASIQSNLGDVLEALGARETSTEDSERAAAASRSALQVYQRESNPLSWAKTQNHLADALRDLADRNRDACLFCQALRSHLESWEITDGAAPYYASIAKTGIINDRAALKGRFSPLIFLACRDCAQIEKQTNLN